MTTHRYTYTYIVVPPIVLIVLRTVCVLKLYSDRENNIENLIETSPFVLKLFPASASTISK